MGGGFGAQAGPVRGERVEALGEGGALAEDLAGVTLPRLWWSPRAGELAITCLDAAEAIGPVLRGFGGVVLASALASPWRGPTLLWSAPLLAGPALFLAVFDWLHADPARTAARTPRRRSCKRCCPANRSSATRCR